MSMNSDPIFVLESLGYTGREAAFLYLVAVHSGYFVRRQFDYFTDRNKGSIVMRFLEKARAMGHVESLDYRQGWHVYHLCSRSIYRLVGNSESQLRRRKGDPHVRARLMALDHVLENEGNNFLESETGRIRFFVNDRHIVPEFFMGDEARLHPLLASFPISIADRTRPAQSPVRFAFIDEGLLTIEKFLRYLSAAEPLLRAVGSFEVVYVSLSASHFEAAKEAFWSRFRKDSPASPGLFEDDARPVAAPPRVALQPRFTTLLLRYSYPILQRSEIRGSERVRI
jgi:hypothetical protein